MSTSAARLWSALVTGMIAGVVAILLAAVLATSSASAFVVDYCGRYVRQDGYYCGHGNYNSITYNRGTDRGDVYGLCVYMITEAGNTRGYGNGTYCTSGDSVSECFSTDTPRTEGRTFPQQVGKTLWGHVDNSPNHTNCIY